MLQYRNYIIYNTMVTFPALILEALDKDDSGNGKIFPRI